MQQPHVEGVAGRDEQLGESVDLGDRFDGADDHPGRTRTPPDFLVEASSITAISFVAESPPARLSSFVGSCARSSVGALNANMWRASKIMARAPPRPEEPPRDTEELLIRLVARVTMAHHFVED